jgi:flagellar biosynthesis/type III secretory pathway chaperone
MRKKTVARQYMQYRAEDLKSLTEQRADLVQQMKDLTSTAETEQRAFSQEEDQQFDDLDKQVKALDSTIEKLERARDLKLNVISLGNSAYNSSRKNGRACFCGLYPR